MEKWKLLLLSFAKTVLYFVIVVIAVTILQLVISFLVMYVTGMAVVYLLILGLFLYQWKLQYRINKRKTERE